MERYNSTSLAYDLSRFQRPSMDEVEESKSPQREKTQAKKTQPAKSLTLGESLDRARGLDRAVASARRVKMLKTFAVCATTMLMLGTVVYNQATLAEINRDITHTKKEITQLQNEYARKTVELEQRINLEKAEEVATVQLGMTQMDTNQIEYITLNQNQTETAAEETEKPGLMEKLNKFVENLLAYIKGQ